MANLSAFSAYCNINILIVIILWRNRVSPAAARGGVAAAGVISARNGQLFCGVCCQRRSIAAPARCRWRGGVYRYSQQRLAFSSCVSAYRMRYLMTGGNLASIIGISWRHVAFFNGPCCIGGSLAITRSSGNKQQQHRSGVNVYCPAASPPAGWRRMALLLAIGSRRSNNQRSV